MSERFFAAAIDGEQALLQGGEAHHLAHVMRAEIGAEVVLFDGSGFEYVARVRRIGRTEVQLEICDRRETDRELNRRVTLAVALPKGDRQRWLVEKAVELGVARLVPIKTQRGVAQPSERALQRLERAVIEASKQCGRNRLMEMGPSCAFDEFVAAASPDAVRLIAHPGGAATCHGQRVSDLVSTEATDYLLLIGPEGGFTEEEVATAGERGWRTVHLGPRMLRVETAALALTSLVALR